MTTARRRWHDWFMSGYSDAQDGTPYERNAHGGKCLCEDCEVYQEGWSAGIRQNVSEILRKKVA